MIGAGRPLRFLAVVTVGWVGARAFVLWPSQIVPALIGAVAPAATAEPAPVRATAARPALAVAPPNSHAAQDARSARVTARPTTAAAVFAVSSGASPPPDVAATSPAPPPDPRLPGVDPPPVFTASRWSGSAWAILRPDGRATPFASQLGGSQAGARIAYAVDGARRLALYARASTAIDAAQREAAVGVDWRPTRLPVHLVAERRIGIEGVRGGTAIGAVGGVGPTRVAGPVRIEGYAQGGVIFRARAEGYADGSLRITLPATGRVDLGIGAWGGAQQGAARLDLGPTLGVTIPVERHALRLSVDWRARVAGDARPGSGPAMSLGVDF